MRRISVLVILLAALATLALAAAPAGSLSVKGSGGMHLACGGSSGGCQHR